MNLITAQDGPITATIKGKSYIFHVWRTKQLIPVLSRLLAQRIAILKKQLTEQKVPAQQAAYTLYQEESQSLTPHDAHRHFMSAEGVDECLIEPLVRAGMAREEANELIEPLLYDFKADLAIKVANIYEPKAPIVSVPASQPGIGFGDQQKVPDQPVGFGENPTDPAKAGQSAS